jgi:hypothetical protein
MPPQDDKRLPGTIGILGIATAIVLIFILYRIVFATGAAVVAEDERTLKHQETRQQLHERLISDCIARKGNPKTMNGEYLGCD